MSAEDIHFSEHFGIPVTMTVGGHEIPGILDTGASTVCFQESLCRALVDAGVLTRVGKTHVGGAVSRSEATVYRGTVGVKGLDGFGKDVSIIGLPTSTALLGRNLLRYLYFGYDGPGDRIHLSDKPTPE